MLHLAEQLLFFLLSFHFQRHPFCHDFVLTPFVGIQNGGTAYLYQVLFNSIDSIHGVRFTFWLQFYSRVLYREGFGGVLFWVGRILHCGYHFSWVLYVWVGMVTLGWLDGTFTFLCESRFALKPLITAEKAF